MITPSLYHGKHVAVFGLGKDGNSAVKALHAAGAKVFAWDDNEKGRSQLASQPGMEQAISKGEVTLLSPDDYDWKAIKVLILSPGIPFTHPAPHHVVVLAKKAAVPIICTLELLYLSCPESRYIGITGTNGKSTTTALTGHIMKSAGILTEVGGNIGIPAMDLQPLGKDGVYVLEMSSYQLDLLRTLTCSVSILLNITPDHIDRHGNMDGYIAAKKHIFARQGKNAAAVVGIDNTVTKAIYKKLKSERAIGKVVGISAEHKEPGGLAVINGICYNDIDGKGEEIEIGQLKRLAGKHNAENMAAAIAAAVLSGVSIEKAIAAVKTFEGLRHRMQYLGEINGVTFVNDSKATNAEAAEKALLSYDNIYWIAGGVQKEGGIAMLEPLFSRVCHTFLIGQCQHEFAKTLEGKVPYTICDTLDKAFAIASDVAFKEGKGVVMLSPACASFDQWPNFEVRGDRFCTLVEELSANN